LARPAGLEPATWGFEGGQRRFSIKPITNLWVLPRELATRSRTKRLLERPR